MAHIRLRKNSNNKIWIIKNGVIDENKFNLYFQITPNTTQVSLNRSGSQFTYRISGVTSDAYQRTILKNLSGKDYYIEIDNLSMSSNYGSVWGCSIYDENYSSNVLIFVDATTPNSPFSNTPFITNKNWFSGYGTNAGGYWREVTFRVKNLYIIKD